MKNKKEVFNLTNEFTLKSAYLQESMIEGCVQQITCKTTGVDCETENDVVVGRSSFLVVKTLHEDVVYNWSDILDLEARTAPYMALFDYQNNGLSNSAYEAIGAPEHIFPEDVMDALIVDRLEIAPEYRGNSYGEIIISDAIEKFGQRVGIIAVKPFPLQFENILGEQTRASEDDRQWHLSMQLEKLDSNRKKAFAKLQSYYQSLGFNPAEEGVFLMQNPLI